MVENTDTPVNISKSDSMDPPRLDEPPSPPHTPTIPTVPGQPFPTQPIRRSQQSNRQVDFGPYVTS